MAYENRGVGPAGFKNRGSAQEIKKRAASGYRAKCAVIGASRMNRNHNTQSGAIWRSLPIGAVNWFQLLAGIPFDIVSYDAVGGQGIDDVEATLDAHVFAYNVDIVIMGGDCIGNYTNNGGSVANAMTIFDRIAAKMFARDIVFVVATCSPNVQLTSTNDAAYTKGDKYHQANRLVRARCRADDRYVLWPWDEWANDLSEATGRPVVTQGTGAGSTAMTTDNTHDQPRYSIGTAQQLYNAFRNYFGNRTIQLPTSNSDPYRAVANPVNYGTTGTLAGGATGSFVGASCTLTGSGTTAISDVARTDFGSNGVWKTIAVTGATASVTYKFSGRGSLPATIAVGGFVYAVCEIKLNSTPTNLRGFKITMSYTGSATVCRGFDTYDVGAGSWADYSDAGLYIPTAQILYYFTPVQTIPAGVTDIHITVEATKSSVGNMDVNFSVGRADAIVRDALPYHIGDPTIP